MKPIKSKIMSEKSENIDPVEPSVKQDVQKEEKFFAIKEELAQDILKYLGEQKAKDVLYLIVGIQSMKNVVFEK